MKAKLSHKDLILLIGIVVAVVIAFTTWVYREINSNASLVKPKDEHKTSLHVPASSLIQKIIKRTEAAFLPNIN